MFGKTWRWRVRGEQCESGVCASKDLGKKMPKANKESFNDERRWDVSLQLGKWS